MKMKPGSERIEILKGGLVIGTEFALSVIALIFLGYFLGGSISKSMAILGMILGAFLGLAFGTYRLIDRVS